MSSLRLVEYATWRKHPTMMALFHSAEGPKLQPFPQRHLKVTFNRPISDTEYVAGHTDTGGHAHVFAVTIGGKEYALKIFKFYDDEEAQTMRMIGKPLDIDLLRVHTDPFYNECRAYGRIDDAEAYLDKWYELEWNRPDGHKLVSQQQPLQAIVKDLVLDDIPLTQRLVNKMLRDLKKIRALGVYPMDVRKRMNRGGLLLDMSAAMTTPHYVFDYVPKWRIKAMMRQELRDIEDMAKDESFKCIAQRNEEYCYYCTKLRRPSGKKIIYK